MWILKDGGGRALRPKNQKSNKINSGKSKELQPTWADEFGLDLKLTEPILSEIQEHKENK